MLRETTFFEENVWIERRLIAIDAVEQPLEKMKLCAELSQQLQQTARSTQTQITPTQSTQNGQAPQVLTTAETDKLKADALTELLPYLAVSSAEQLELCWQTVFSIKNEWYRTDTLSAMVPYIAASAPHLLENIFESTSSILYKESQFKLLVALAISDSRGDYAHKIEQTLKTLKLVTTELAQSKLLTSIISLLSSARYQHLKSVVIETIEKLEDSSLRAIATIQVIPYVDSSRQSAQLNIALDTIRELDDDPAQAIALQAAIQHSACLPENLKVHLLERSLQIARSFKSRACEVAVIEASLPSVSVCAPALLTHLQAQALEIIEPEARAQLLLVLLSFSTEVEHLERPDIEQIRQTILSIPDDYHEAQLALLAQVAPHVLDSVRAPVIKHMLAIAQSSTTYKQLAQRLNNIAPVIARYAPEQLNKVMRIVLSHPEVREQSALLASVVACLAACDSHSLSKAKHIARSISDEGYRVQALVVISAFDDSADDLADDSMFDALDSQLAEASLVTDSVQTLQQLIQQALSITDIVSRNRTLIAIAPHINRNVPHLITQVLKEVLSFPSDFESPTTRQRSSTQYSELLEAANAAVFKEESDRIKKQKINELLLQQAFKALENIIYEGYRADAITVLARALSTTSAWREKGLKNAREIANPWSRAQALSAIARHTTNESAQTQLITDVFQDIQSIKYLESRVKALSESLAQLGAISSESLARSLQTALATPEERYRTEIFVAIAQHLTVDNLPLTEQLLQKAKRIKNEQYRVQVLVAIAPQLPRIAAAAPHLAEELLQITQNIADEQSRTQVVVAIAPQLPQLDLTMPHFVAQTIQLTQLMRQEKLRTEALIAIAHTLSATPGLERFFPQLIEATSGLSEVSAARVLYTPALRFPELLIAQIPDYKQLIALEIIKLMPDDADADKTVLLGALSPHLSVGLFQNAFYLIKTVFRQERYKAEAFNNLITYLPPDQISAVLEIVENSITTVSHQSDVLETLIPYLSQQQLVSALTLVEQNYAAWPQQSASVLSQIIVALSSKSTLRTNSINALAQPLTLKNVQAALSKSVLSQDDVIQKICELTQQRLLSPESDIVYEQEAADILSQLSALSQLTDQQRKQILQAANSLCDPGYRFHALSGLVPQQPSLARPLPEFCQGDDYRSFLGVKLQLALSDAPIASHLVDRITPGSYRRIEASVAIACKSPESAYQSRALEDIRRIDNTYLKTQYIQQLTPYLINAQRLEAANLIREIGHPYHKTQALVKLACKFPEFRSEAKNTAQRTLLNPVHKIEQLSLLAIEVPEILPEMIDVVEQLQRPIEQTEALIALAPHLPTRINRAIKREYSANFFVSAALWKQALYLLSRSYRDAIKGGSLRNDSAQDKDFLNIQDEVNALANLLLMRDLDPPMAVGILGGWGGGKSYIMHLMQAHMTKVRSYATTETEAWDADPNSEKLSPYVGHIYQIRFDAWTFAKSDLWASLMQTIFFELDRQLTLETQITEVLSGIKDIDKRQAIEQKIWPVLYKSTDDEREWFLKRVLTDRSILEALIQKQKATGSAGILWQKFKESQVTAIDTLAATEAALEQKKAVLETVKAELRSQARQEFEPIFSLTNRRSFQHVDALLGTSFALLRSRIGKNSFKQLNRDIAEQLFDIPSQKTGEQSPDEKSIGMWKRLEAKLSDLDAARRTLEKLEDSQLSEESAENENGQKIEADEQSVPNTARESVTKTGASETDLINQQQQEVNRLLVEVSELRFDIFNVAATVIERKRKFLDHRRNCQWVISNLPLLLLFTVLFLAPLGVIAFLNWNVYKDLDSQIPNLTGKVAAAVAPLLPGIAILQNLVRSGQKWFEETSLALNEYKVSVEKRNKELETTYERVMQESLTSNPRLRQLEAEVQALEQDYEAQKQAVPINQYATLSDFIRDRLDQGTYTKRLGPMQQVKQDLSELSNKLLPPRQYDQSFQAKLEFLKSAFPRGPARVAVYIDDLDRCPPDRVVQVLEAVQLLIKTPLFIAVLAIDERYITRALEKFYSGILLRNGSPSGTDYLEKIIQLPYRVRPIMTNTLETYLRSQVVIQDNAAGISKFSEFSRHEFEMLLECCRQIDLSPRTIKRLTNVYKLFKIVCRTRSSKPTPRVQQTTLALLALSGRYPQLMRGIFNNIQNCFEEQRTKENAQARKNPFHLECSLQTFFQMHRVSGQQIYLQSELEKLRYDAVRTHILPDDITLIELSQGIFNLIRSFSFVGDIGQDPDNYSISNSHYLDHNPPDNLSLFNNS